MKPKEKIVKAAVRNALQKLIKHDSYLLDVDCAEQTISHRLAIYLAEEFPRYDVDCEYNRDGTNVKRLSLAQQCVQVADGGIYLTGVVPDIVVHMRGTHDDNLLVIEMKKAEENIEHDRLKLNAFKAQLNYQYAAHIVVGSLGGQILEPNVIWV